MQRRSFAIGRSRLANKSGASHRGPRVREAFEKGRAKSGESGSIVANARNNVTLRHHASLPQASRATPMIRLGSRELIAYCILRDGNSFGQLEAARLS
jgi:hypothetical protein